MRQKWVDRRWEPKPPKNQDKGKKVPPMHIMNPARRKTPLLVLLFLRCIGIRPVSAKRPLPCPWSITLPNVMVTVYIISDAAQFRITFGKSRSSTRKSAESR